MMTDATQGRHGSLRVLVWKEWREGWPVVLAGAAVMGGLWAVWGSSDPGFWTCLRWSRVVLLVAAALLGGRAFASEMETGTEGFLLALPARRHACWSAKVVPVLLVLVVLAGLPALFEMILLWGRRQFPGGPQVLVIGCRWALLAVAAGSLSLFFSTVIPRTITAILATLASAPLLAIFFRHTIKNAGRHTFLVGKSGELLPFRWSTVYEPAILGAIAILALLASRWIYKRKSVPR